MLHSLKKKWRALQVKTVKSAKFSKPKPESSIKTETAYFAAAKSWADDRYAALYVKVRRYQLAFFSSLTLAGLLCLCLIVLVSTQHTQLVVVHEGASGDTWVTTATLHQAPALNWARTQSEIANYVKLREAYDPLLYAHQVKTVGLLSTAEVQAEYELAQSDVNKAAPINVLGAKGYRTVHIHSILSLDSASKPNTPGVHHINLAEVNFVVIDHLFGENQTVTTPFTALISWRYQGIPTNPAKMLRDWDGFTITKFKKQPVNVTGLS